MFYHKNNEISKLSCSKELPCELGQLALKCFQLSKIITVDVGPEYRVD